MKAAQKHRQFVTEHFSIIDASGTRLVGEIEDQAFDQIGDQPVRQEDLMKLSIGFKLVYTLPSERPEYLTFLQNFGGSDSALPSMMELHVVSSLDILESAQLAHGRSHTVQIDWSKLASPDQRETLAELRQRRKAQFKDRLGISSYSGLYSFVYINRFEVRHEILIPVATLDQMVSLPRAQRDVLSVQEQQAAASSVEQYFKSRGKVEINGQAIDASVQRVSFFSLDIRDFALSADPRPINIHQGRVGVILSYPSSRSPREASVTWSDFTKHAPFVDSIVLIGNEKPSRFFFQPNRETYRWQGDLDGPDVVPLTRAAWPTQQQALAQSFRLLLCNIYQAFEYRDDEAIYDNLAKSLDGPLLRDLYLRIKRSLLMAEQGGQLSYVTDVQVLQCKPKGNQQQNYELKWQVTSQSEHWGHVHTRKSEYRGLIQMQESDGFWKAGKFQVLEEQRLSFETSIRGYDSAK
jgi:hypothetical protein